MSRSGLSDRMGLGLYLAADVPRSGPFGRRPSRENLFHDIAEMAAAFARRQPAPLGEWFDSSPVDDTLYVDLFPVEENAEFNFGDEKIICSAKTSTAGPGYHAYLVDLLDELRGKLGLDWRAGEGDSADETEYFDRRSFARLQRTMLDWLQGLSRTLVARIDEFTPPVMLGMPVGFAPKSEAFAASSMGEWPRQWFERIAASEGADLVRAAEAFFPWWDRTVTAKALRGFALSRCWMDIRWTVPANESERRLYSSTLGCFERAIESDSGLSVPELAIAKLRSLLSPDAEVAAPDEVGIGHLRRVMRRPLPGQWTIDLPGYYYSELEDDGGTQVYWFADRTVRASSISFKPLEGKTAADVLGEIDPDKGEASLPLEHDHLVAKYTFARDDGDDCFMFQACVAKADGKCIITICFSVESDRLWAEHTAASVTAAPPP